MTPSGDLGESEEATWLPSEYRRRAFRRVASPGEAFATVAAVDRPAVEQGAGRRFEEPERTAPEPARTGDGTFRVLRHVPAGTDTRPAPTHLAYHRVMSEPIPDDVRAFLDSHAYATVATLDPDGAPYQVRAWYLLEDDRLILNSADGRRWPANLRRDPRVSVVVDDGYDWVRLSGVVEVDDTPERAQADIARMARRYDEPDEAERAIRERFERQARVTFVLRPERVHAELGD
jgi:PPOX class probable F420-dependent enzyme